MGGEGERIDYQCLPRIRKGWWCHAGLTIAILMESITEHGMKMHEEEDCMIYKLGCT